MSSPLTKEQIRNARLLALGVAANPSDSTAASTGQSSHTSSSTNTMEPMQVESQFVPANEPPLTMSMELFTSLQTVMYKGGNATSEDMLRWYDQGFNFCNEPYFGLRQGNGGPCGILAAVQAELLSELLFGNDGQRNAVLPEADQVDVQSLLSKAMCNIVHRASHGGKIIIVYIPESLWQLSMEQWEPSLISTTYYSNKEEACRALNTSNMHTLFRSGMGCIAFLASLICTRGVDYLKEDMDDAGSTCTFHNYLPVYCSIIFFFTYKIIFYSNWSVWTLQSRFDQLAPHWSCHI